MFSLTKSFSAISRLLRPAAISPRISCSRGVIPSCLESRAIDDERTRRGLDRDVADHGDSSRTRVSFEAEPDAKRREDERHEPAVDLERVLDDQKAVLDELEGGDQRAAEEPEEERRLPHATTLSRVPPHCHAYGAYRPWNRCS